MDAVFRDSDLDVLLFPGGLGNGGYAAMIASRKQYPLVSLATNSWERLAQIKATVPVGVLDSGEPVAVCLMGQHGHDATLLRCM